MAGCNNALPSLVTIIVPALDEERYIRRAIESLQPQDDSVDYEIIVLDGGSTDRTRQIVRELAVADRRIRLVANNARLQSAAVNKGARLAKAGSKIIIRADSHSIYPPDFVARLVRELQERRVTSIVVPLHAAGTSPFQRAVAAAQNCRLGHGGAPHRAKVPSHYVDHGHHAAFDRAAFLSVGGYDETFSHNEDAELDVPAPQGGGEDMVVFRSRHHVFSAQDDASAGATVLQLWFRARENHHDASQSTKTQAAIAGCRAWHELRQCDAGDYHWGHLPFAPSGLCVCLRGMERSAGAIAPRRCLLGKRIGGSNHAS